MNSRKYLTLLLVLACVAVVYADPQFTAPCNEADLQIRLKELKEEYSPYLRSLPEKVESRSRILLNGEWKFVFEVKDPPKKDTPLPPAPEWYGTEFDDSEWEDTTVPEWRYRTVGHDNLYIRKVDLKPVTWKHLNCDLHFRLTSADGKVISEYRRQLRCVPKQLLNKDIQEHVVDPFNQKKI